MTSTYRIRYYGQAEMRGNVYRALREQKLTQRELAEKAGFKVSHLTGFFQANTWLRTDAAESLAYVLAIPFDELVGDSIFKHQTDRYDEFSERHPYAEPGEGFDGMAEHETPVGKERGLCCECGTMSVFKDGFDFDTVYDRTDGPRMLHQQPCSTCGDRTWHAALRSDQWRDAAEEDMPNAGAKTDAEVEELHAYLTRLATEFGIDVHEGRCSDRNIQEGRCVRSTYDEAKSRWRIELDYTAPPVVLRAAVESAFLAIYAQGQEGADERAYGATERAWQEAADSLAGDFQRFLGAERMRAAKYYTKQAFDARDRR